MYGQPLLVVYTSSESLYHYVDMMEDPVSHFPFYLLSNERKEKQKVNERQRERLAQFVKKNTQWLMWIIEKSIKFGYAFEKVRNDSNSLYDGYIFSEKLEITTEFVMVPE